MINLPDPERWRQIDALFEEALERAPPEQRDFVRHASGGDEALYAEVCALLERVTEAERVLGDSATDFAGPLLQSLGAESERAATRVGEQIGPYQVLNEVGRGGMGIVYRARDVRLDRLVALKFLPPYLSGDEEAKRRFTAEARAASATEHPNVASLYEIGETTDGQIFLVLAYYEGETLKERMAREGALPVEEALDVAMQVAAGLAATHAEGVIHRDIKPGNVLLARDGWVKILDFGVAKIAGGDATGPGMRLGTVGYISPEQLRADDVDARTDVWSLGVVLYEMLTGERPFRGGRDEIIINAILHDEPAALGPGEPDLPEALARVVSRALAKDRSERYRTAEELLQALEAVARISSPGRAEAPETWIGGIGWMRRGSVGVTLIVSVALSAAGWGLLRQPAPVALDSGPVGLAVLPFSNVGDDPGGSYFADGITEDIVIRLSGISGLRVISRTSIMPYRERASSLAQVGDELGVDHIVEGSVQRSGDRLRINVKLMDARTEQSLWAEAFDRQAEDIFVVQSEIAERIAAALHAELTPLERRLVGARPTDDLAAYDLYLQGLEYLHRYRREDNEVAITLLKRAIVMDPTFALAYARLGASYALKVFQYGDGYIWADSALSAAERAIALDPDLPEGHVAFGLSNLAWERYEIALEGFQRALDLNPNYPGALTNVGIVKWRLGAYDEALPWYRRALDFGPVDQAIALSTMAGVYAFLGLFEHAEDAVGRALALQPALPLAHYNALLLQLVQGRNAQAVEQAGVLLTTSPGNARAWASAGTAFQFSGDWARARHHFARAYEISPTSFDLLWRPVPVLLGQALWKAGEEGRALELVEASEVLAHELIASGNEGPFLRYNLAAVHAIQGREEEALDWLEEAVALGRKDYLFLSRDPLFENLWGHERFQAVVAANRAELERQRARVQQEGW